MSLIHWYYVWSRQAELLERKKRKKLRQKEQREKDQKKDAKEDGSTTSEEQQYPAESSSPLSVASDSEAQRPDSISIDDSSSLEDPRALETNNERNGESQAPMLDDDGFGNGQNMDRRIGRRQMERSQQGMQNGFHANHSQKPGGMRKNGTNRDARGSTTKVWSRKSDIPKSILQHAAVTQLDQTKNSAVLIGSVSVTIRNSGHSGELNQTKCSEEEGRTKTVEAKPTSEQSTVKMWRPVSSQGRKVSTVDENTDREDKNSNPTTTEVKTAHHISLQFNNYEAKAFLAKSKTSLNLLYLFLSPYRFDFNILSCILNLNGLPGWKEATSEEHVTLVLSQETDILGNNTHESSNGVLTARPKLRMKPDKGAKVKYVPKQRIP